MAEPGPPHKAAEAPGLRKPPGPSRLRHEIHPESTDDESNRPRGVLEVPNSDPDDDDDEPPGSPGTEEMLKKLSAPRSKRSLDTQPIVVGLLTRGNAPSADLNEPIGFSYGRPTAGLAKPLPVPGKAPANNSGHQSGKKGKENTGFTKALATTDNTSPNNNGVHQPGNGGLPNRRPEARTQSQSLLHVAHSYWRPLTLPGQPAKHRGKAGDNVSIQKQQHRSSFKPSAVSPEGAASRELHEQPLDSLKPLHLPPRGPRKQSFKLHSERQSRKIGGQDAQARQDHGQRVNVEPSRSSSSQELLASQAARETSISSRPSADQSFAAAEGDTVPTPENDTACQGDLSLDRAAGPTIQGSSINEFGLEPMDLSENNAMGSSQTRHSRPCSTQQLQQLHRVASEPQAASEHSRPVSQQQLQPTLQQQQPTLQQQQPTLQQQQPTLQQQQIAPEPLIPPTAVSTQREHPSKSPRTRSSAPSGCSRPTGVRKPQHRTRPQVHTAPIDQAQSPGQVGRFSKLFEGHLQNVRAVFYAEVMQNEHIQDAEIRVRETKIEGLKESVDEAKRDAAAIRERNFDLSVELRYQLKVVADMQKYVSQLKNDHMRNCVEPRARRIAELQREKSNLEKEKAELESEFTRVIQSLQNGRRATSQAFEECLAQYKTSEEKRLALIEVLKRQERLLESEGQKREEMERQLAASLTSIKIQLEANPEKFIEGLNDIRRRFDARDTKDRQDNSVRKCLEVLNDLKELSARHAGKPIKIETETISQCIDPKLSALSAAIGNIKIPTQDLQDLMSNQLAIIKTDILKHQALSAELQKVNSDKDVLSQQLNHQTAKCKELEEKLERFQQTESDLKARATRLETDLAELKRQINDAKPSRRELEQQLIGLRDQLAQANRRADDAASNVEEAKRLRKDNQREAVEQKV
ncbi:hypothetical protein M011DRAFT_146749 [Sporormia fimetaria CBS 119925]|uniref:Uncharacterized protein n=1 Tax=Sporormia fimetaria CBS 119925 TaxID=1340428 RepID=A0A6A6V4E9_9PLEO|nr:hypothetical protein M011DRAFT_146749 [Sporormia fimetaria CBS 119925]